jgi:importin subunit alpha-6/7
VTQTERKALFKQGLDLQSTRRRRQETTQQIRKNKKEENLMKRRQGAVNNNADEAMSANTATSLPLKNKPTIADIPDFMKVITNPASPTEDLIEAVRGIRRMLSVETNPPVNEVLATGILPYLVNFLQKYDSWVLMFESSWTLTNIASTQRTKDVVDGGAVPLLIALLSHEKADLREQAIWCLGNIAGDCTDFRDYLIQQGIMEPL